MPGSGKYRGVRWRLQRMTAASRVRRMERCFDTLQAVAREDPEAFRSAPKVKKQLGKLIRYYEGGQWLRDYMLDEQGGLPQELKRGVLAQDGVCNFLESLRED